MGGLRKFGFWLTSGFGATHVMPGAKRSEVEILARGIVLEKEAPVSYEFGSRLSDSSLKENNKYRPG